MAGRSSNSFGAKNWSPGPPATRYNVSGKNREFYTFENAPGLGNYATGGTIIDGGDGYIYHIFTGNGTFQVNRPPAAIDSVDYLIVAGGGGAAPIPAPGANAGGGGGGMLFGNIGVSNAPGAYSIVVGGGGPSGPGQTAPPRNGSPSTAFGLTATGGGGGGGAGPVVAPGAPGGSGGGSFAGPGGAGNTPATIPRQGYNGGSGIPASVAAGGGGGAGGLGSAATAPTAPVGGAGGPGRIAPEFPSTIISKAIPAPVLPDWSPLVGPGGYAAGGHGMNVPAPLQRTSPANSGYGGQTGGLGGGSGIVCVRYKKTVPYSRATGGTIEPSTHPEHPGVWRHIFTSPGDFTVTDPTLQWIDYTAVAGGGGGGGGGPVPTAPNLIGGGGGGAGGFVSSIHTSSTTPLTIPQAYPWNPGYSVQVGEQYPVGVGTYPIGIGTGGNGGGVAAIGSTGSNTTIGSPGLVQIIAFGGGGGGALSAGTNGGSGGGASRSLASGPAFSGGTASPPPTIQGNPGGAMPLSPSTTSGGGGGGGAGAAAPVGPGPLTPGGIGQIAVLCPSSYGTPGPVVGYRYLAGGGGGGWGNTTTGGTGGSGGGGNGATPSGGPTSVSAGTTNTGGGGGGGAPSGGPGGNGGPGIVIIQYPE